MSKKQYGLIIPNKKVGSGLTISRPSIFDEDSDSDTPKAKKPTGYTKVKKQDLISQQKALEEDPTVYQYDEVYDEIETKRKETKLAQKNVEKKPKYIVNLLAAADRRKREHERRIERQVQKEREAEGEEFKDKESFVTSSYKKKLEELRALEEAEKREEYLESIGDVTKQGNLDGFYRHLYDQKVNYVDKDKEKEEPSKSKDEPGPSKKPRCSSNSDDSDNNAEKAIKRKSDIKSRTYRSRKEDSDSEDEKADGKEELPKQHLPSNLDADSDFSVDSSSDSDSEEEQVTSKPETDKKEIDKSIEHEGEKLKLPDKGNVLSDNASLLKKIEGKDDQKVTDKESKNDLKKEKSEDLVEKVEEKEEKPKKPKVDIWKKRTVGAVFDEAVKRYFERKAVRGW
ncbi:nuclear speckle splicing regulatory protein 1 [Anthonomus grandis grandis]|uniref:nuclear speckle splicing regulatory protein 1 n=1 Tax=Anthonomus grandis grandis TaxID=2921223 RepID=UPI002165C271|nr:nuclear speckle splicing regulatory protein 1 [Anthonomus grandis grandis]